MLSGLYSCVEYCEQVFGVLEYSLSSARRLRGAIGGWIATRGVSDGVESELLLHVSLGHLPKRFLVLFQQLEDGGQLLPLYPGKTHMKEILRTHKSCTLLITFINFINNHHVKFILKNSTGTVNIC